MADRFRDTDEAEAVGGGEQAAADTGAADPAEEAEKAPSKRRRKREARAADREKAKLARGAEDERRRKAKAEARERKRIAKAERKRRKAEDTGKPKRKEKPATGKDKRDDEDAASDRQRRRRTKAEPKPLADRLGSKRSKPEPEADEEPKAKRRREREPHDRRGAGKDGERRAGRGLSAKAAKASLLKALPGKAGDSETEAKPKRAKGERRPAGTLERAFTQVLAIVGALIAGVVGVVAVVVKALAGPAKKARDRIAAWIAALSRFLTPTRGLMLAAVGCAILLGLSQFVDYRGISIGADAYAPGIQTVAPAPEVQRAELGSAHSYAMIPLALLAIAVLAVAVRTKRWQLCRLAVLLGLVAIAVAILVDRPAGLDEGDLNRDFTGVEAKLLGGYWMQIFAGAGLAITSFLLAGEIKRDAPVRVRRNAPSGGARAGEERRDPDRRPGDRKDGKPKRRGLRRRSPRSTGSAGPEGAGA